MKCNKTKYLIVTIVKNTAIDLYRKKSKQPLIDIEEAEAIPDINSQFMDDIVIRLGDAKMLAEKLAKLKS